VASGSPSSFGQDKGSDLPPAVAWRQVGKEYPGGRIALRDVSLQVARGEFLAILGTSGSGKTTLLKMVNRLIEPTSGEVLVHGKPTSQWDPIALRRSIGYVIQEGGLMPHLTILANVGLVPRLRGVPHHERDALARARLELVGLDPDQFGPQMPHQLSGGQRQRVGVARALAADPDLMLMDEPFGALDPITRREIQVEFRSLQQRLRMTVVFVTHEIREAYRIADRLAIMDHGTLIQEGPPGEFRERPANDFVRSFFLDAEAVRAAGEKERA
jgi:osmoprotectant transport system ATP-binding protein